MNETLFENMTPLGPASSSSRIFNNTQTSEQGDESAVNALATSCDEHTTPPPPPPPPPPSQPPNLPRNKSLSSGLFKSAVTNQATSSSSSDQALLSAIYNTIAISLLVICVGLCGLLLVVLQAFVRAILWAMLTSACLFSLKQVLTDAARRRLARVEASGSTLALELVLAPLRLIDAGVDWLWSWMSRRRKQFLALAFAVLVFNLGNVFSYGFIKIF